MKFGKFRLKNLLKPEYLFLLIIILIGSFLRVDGIITNSFAFTYDIGRDLIAVSDLVNLHKFSLIGPTTGLPGVFYGPVWYYILTPFFVIFSGNPQGVALGIAVMGILSIVMGFYLGKKIGNSFLGLAIASLISVSPGFVSLTQIWSPNIIPFFILLILLVLIKVYETKEKTKLLYFFLFGLLLGIVIELEIVFGVIFSAGIILSTLLIVKRKINLRQILLFALGVSLSFITRIIFELRHEFLMTKSLLGFLGTGSKSYGVSSPIEIFGLRLNDVLNNFSFSLSLENTILGLILMIFILLVFVLNYKKLGIQIKNFYKTSLIVIGVFILGLNFFKHDIWPHYMVGLVVFYVLALALSIYVVYKNNNKYLAVLVLFAILLVNLNPLKVWKDFTNSLWEGDASVYRNQIAVVDYVYTKANGKDFKFVTYTPPVHDYTYRYLFSWYGEKKYHYLPKQISNLAFFILEPDKEYPIRLTNWLKDREKDGVIIKSETIKGGIVVQTRITK